MRITLVGFGLSNRELFKRIKNRYEIFVSETRKLTSEEKILLRGFEYEEEHSKKLLDSDLIVVSPGISPRSFVGKMVLESGIRRGTELDKAFELLDLEPGIVIGVTGTNGKTTTSSMIAHVLSKFGYEVFLGGNNENPVSRMVKRYDFTVLEISSFQLFWAESLKIDIGLVINISHDHEDWHGSFKDYVRSKLRMAEFSKKFLVGESASRYVDARVFDYIDPEDVPHHLRTNQNVENVSAVVSALRDLGFDEKKVIEALSDFVVPQHRMELVDEIDGVLFYDDSKATNVHAVERAISNFDPKRVVLIVSGILKEDPSKLKEILENVKGFVVLGGRMGKTLGLEHVDTMEEAVKEAFKMAEKGDVVLLSPAGASFDMFRNYAERGESFKRAVEGLKVGI